MSDTKFKWLVSAICITAITIAGMFIFQKSITKRSKEKETKELKYIYIDDCKIVHTDRKCKRLNYKYTTSKRHSLDQFEGPENYCPNCVTDAQYETIQNKL